jgi:hypothetical protein
MDVRHGGYLRSASAEDKPEKEKVKLDSLMGRSFRHVEQTVEALILGLFAGFSSDFFELAARESKKGGPFGAAHLTAFEIA